MNSREHRNPLSFEDFMLPFGGYLSAEKRGLKHADLIPWDNLEDDYQSESGKVLKRPPSHSQPARAGSQEMISRASIIICNLRFDSSWR